jgi:hypothetical protein
MSDEHYKVIKEIMENPELADEMEKVQPGVKAQMSGYLLSPWLPHGAARKVVMIVIALVAVLGYLMTGSGYFLLALLLLPMFSPRLVGEAARALGKAKGNK